MENEMTKFDVDCRICGETQMISANEVDVCNWQDGVLIQEAMPYLTTGERELFISGTCDNCWEDMFGNSCGIDF